MSQYQFDKSVLNNAEDLLAFVTNILTASTEYSIIGTDLEGTILLWNEGARRIYGYEPEEVIGQFNTQRLYAPEEHVSEHVHKIREIVLTHGKWEGIIKRIRKNGETFPARVVITPRRDQQGQVIGFLVISKDISGELLLEELKVLQLYTRSLVEANLDALIITDLVGTITDVNQQMCRLTGYSRETLLGSPYQRYFTEPQLAELGLQQVQSQAQVTNYELLFVEFQQLDTGMAKKYQGTGLGLVLTKRLVEAQGGTVRIRSVPGQGSTFSAILPRVSQQRSMDLAEVVPHRADVGHPATSSIRSLNSHRRTRSSPLRA